MPAWLPVSHRAQVADGQRLGQVGRGGLVGLLGEVVVASVPRRKFAEYF